jgi:hypothetical protein
MGQLPVKHDLRAYRGDTWSQSFRFIWQGDPVDLSTATVTAWAVNCEGHWDLPATGGADGIVTIAMPDPEIPVSLYTYEYDIEVTEQDGTVTTWVRGRLKVDQDVTNTIQEQEGVVAGVV